MLDKKEIRSLPILWNTTTEASNGSGSLLIVVRPCDLMITINKNCYSYMADLIECKIANLGA